MNIVSRLAVVLVDGDVGLGAGAEVAAVLEAEAPGRPGPRQDRDLVERVLAVERGQRRILQGFRVDLQRRPGGSRGPSAAG